MHVALGDIKRGDGGVGETAGQDTTQQALAVVVGVMGDVTCIAGVPGLSDSLLLGHGGDVVAEGEV